MDTRKIDNEFKENYEYVGESEAYDDELNPKVVKCDKLEELFEAKRIMHQFDAPNIALTPNSDFEVRISVTNEDNVVLFKESIDTYMPLFASEAEDGGVNYNSMSKVMTEGDNLPSVENVFDFLRMKKENGVDVSLQMEVVDKDFGVVIFDNDIDKVKFMEAAIDAKQRFDVAQNLKKIGKNSLAIAAVYTMLNIGVIDNNTLDTTKDIWNIVVGTPLNNVVDVITSSIETFTQGASGEATNTTDLLKAAVGGATETLKFFTESPMHMVGAILGLPIFDAAKKIYNSQGENAEKAERLNHLYGNETQTEIKKDIINGYSPSMNI